MGEFGWKFSLLLSSTHGLYISLKIQRINIENRDWNHKKDFWGLESTWFSLHLQLKISLISFSCSQVLILSFSSIFTSHFYSWVYFWLLWLLISCIPALFYHPNAYSYVYCTLECPFLVASLFQVDNITF